MNQRKCRQQPTEFIMPQSCGGIGSFHTGQQPNAGNFPTLIHPFINFRHIVNNWTDNLRNQYHTLFIYNELIMLISNQQTVDKQPENTLSTNS